MSERRTEKLGVRLAPLQDFQGDSLELLAKKVLETAKLMNSPDSLSLEIDFSNTLAVLGPRGGAKSTFLWHYYRRWKGLSPEAKGKLLVLEPLDCSILPPRVVPGAAILTHLLGDARSERDAWGTSARHKELADRLKGLIQLYSRTDKAYGELSLELSTTPEDYGRLVTKAIQERMGLGRRLEEWSHTFADELGILSAVVLLDDFDLVSVSRVRRWMLSLLDELRSVRIVFVLSADLYRLEHLAWDPRKGFDDKTGRAQLSKLLPLQNQVSLGAWPMRARLAFQPIWGEKRATLGALLSALDTNSYPALLNLLPEWPRGLRNLHRQLEDGVSGGTPKPEAPSIGLLSDLATCRGEPLLARHLVEQEVGYWVRTFPWPHERLSTEAWKDAVEASRWRVPKPSGPSADTVPAIKGLEPQIKPETLPERSVAQTQLQHDPSWADPTRHDVLKFHPLRDASEGSRPLWAELLVDLAMQKDRRSRAFFLTRWKPVADRTSEAAIPLRAGLLELRLFFESHASNPVRPLLHWLDLNSKSGTVSIGWEPLLRAVRGDRDPVSEELLSNVAVSIDWIQGDIPFKTPEDGLAIVPDRAWAVILLTDALHRCPWKALSQATNWDLMTTLAISAAFVRSAYLFPLAEAGIPLDGNPPLQAVLFDCIRRGDASPLLQRHDEADLVGQLCRMFQAPRPSVVLEHTDSLSRSARAFLESPVYTAFQNVSIFRP